MNAPNSPHRLSERFPILDEGLYVNHAAISPWPRESHAAVADYAQQVHRRGPLDYPQWLSAATRLRQAAAELINAPGAGDVSLLTNTSEGINTLAAGLDWKPGDNLVMAARDFPSNTLPWLALAGRGVEVRAVETRRAEDPEAALLERLDRHTRVLAVSAVDWIDGFRLDLRRLGRACKATGTLLFVDAIQQLGALRLDVQGEEIDVLAAGTHKWLMGPEGMGLFYCRETVRRDLAPSRIGWHMLEDRFDFSRDGRQPAADGRRFEPGTPNRIGQIALSAALGVLLDEGPQQVEQRVLANTAQLMGGLTAIRGIALISDTSHERRSGIVTFHAPGVDADAVLSTLRQRRVYAVGRGNGIRLSPHYYQGSNEMQRLLEEIEAAVHGNRTT